MQNKWFKIALVLIVAFLSARLFLLAVDVASNISEHPIVSLLMRLAFLAILTVLVLLRKKENIMYLFICAFPFLKISFNGISILTIFAFLLLFLYFKEIAKYLAGRKDIFIMPFMVLFLSMIYATVIAKYPLESLAYLIFFLSLFTIYLVLTILLKDEVVRKNVIVIMMFILAFSVFVSLSQIIFGIGKIKLFFGNYGNNVNVYGDAARPPSIFWEAQFAGLYFAMMIFLCLGAANLFLKRWLAIFLSILSVFAMILTGTRMAFLALACGLIFIQLFAFKLKKLFFAIFIGLVVLIFVGTGFYNNIVPMQVKQRLTARHLIGSFDYRLNLWKRSFSILPSNPLGIGMGGSNVYEAASKHHVYLAKQYQRFDDPLIGTQFDSTYLDILYPLGVLGFFGFFYIMFTFITVGIRMCISETNIGSRGFVLYLIALMVCWMIGITTSHVFYDNQAMAFFVIFVALLSAEYNKFSHDFKTKNN